MSLIQQPGVKFGLMSAGFAILLQIILYSIGPEKYLNGWTGVSWFAMLVFAFIAGAAELKLNENLLPFPKALIAVFTVMVITEFFAVLTEFAFYNIVNPEFYITAKEIRIEQTARSFESFSNLIDYNDNDRDEIMEEVEKADFQFYVSNAASKFVVWLTIDFLFALILAAIIKKDAPVSERTN